MNYNTAIQTLNGKNAKKIDHNTFLQKEHSGSVSILFHKTKILTYQPSGEVNVSAGGYKTTTTKERINKFLPDKFSYKLVQENYSWRWNNGKNKILFIDGQDLMKF